MKHFLCINVFENEDNLDYLSKQKRFYNILKKMYLGLRYKIFIDKTADLSLILDTKRGFLYEIGFRKDSTSILFSAKKHRQEITQRLFCDLEISSSTPKELIKFLGCLDEIKIEILNSS